MKQPEGDAVERILRRDAVLDRVGFSYSTLRRKVKAGEFPQPIRLGPRMIGWWEFEVGEWLDSRERADMEGF